MSIFKKPEPQAKHGFESEKRISYMMIYRNVVQNTIKADTFIDRTEF